MSNTIEYNGYIATVEYSFKDKCLFGKVEMVDNLVTFEATNVEDLESNFKNAVDEYIETCKQLRIEPQKIYKGVFNIRMEPELHRKIYKEALKSGQSLNAYVKGILAKQVL